MLFFNSASKYSPSIVVFTSTLLKAIFFTTTLHLYFLLSTLPVITAVPAFFAITRPYELTVAILLLLDFHFTFFEVPTIFNEYPSPIFKVLFDLFICKFFTVILHLYFLPPTLAVIVAVPFFFAVTFPFEFTVATFLLLEVHLTFLDVPVIFSVYFSPTFSVFFVLFIFIPVAACTVDAIFKFVNTPGMLIKTDAIKTIIDSFFNSFIFTNIPFLLGIKFD